MSILAKIIPMPRGTYSSSTVYNTLDIVRYDNKSWMCRQDNVQNVTPVDGTTWMLLVEGGSGSLANLTDTNIDDPQDQDFLVYNGTSDEWENKHITIPTPEIPVADSETLGGIKTGLATGLVMENEVLKVANSDYIKRDSSFGLYVRPIYNEDTDQTYILSVSPNITIPANVGVFEYSLQIPIGSVGIDKYYNFIPMGARLGFVSGTTNPPRIVAAVKYYYISPSGSFGYDVNIDIMGYYSGSDALTVRRLFLLGAQTGPQE